MRFYQSGMDVMEGISQKLWALGISIESLINESE